MTILEKMNLLIEKKKSYQTEIEENSKLIKKDFEEYIQNKDISIEDRWALFLKSPDEIKNHLDYLIKTKSKGMKYILESFEECPESYGRGKKVETKELFEDIFIIETLSFNDSDYDEKELFLYKDAIEEILRQNCGSFCIDW